MAIIDYKLNFVDGEGVRNSLCGRLHVSLWRPLQCINPVFFNAGIPYTKD